MGENYNRSKKYQFPERRLRVAHLLSGKEGGGILTVGLSLIENLDPNVAEASILLLSPNALSIDKRAQGYKCHLIRKRFRGSLLVVFRIILYCRKNQIDILHTHSIPSNFYGRLAGIFLNRTYVVTSVHAWTRDELRSAFGDSRRSAWLYRMDLWMSRFSDQLIAVSQALKEELILLGMPEEKTHAVPHGIKVEDFEIKDQEIDAIRRNLRLLPGEKIIGIVGRLTAVKNHTLFLHAAKLVSKRYRDCRYVIAGDGPLRQDLEELARDLSIADSVIFTGWVDHIPALLHLMDIVVMTSRSEGFGYVLLEAMACGRPIIATRVSEIPRIISHGKNGLLVPPGDAKMLANTIEFLLRDPRRRIKMGKCARQSVTDKFGIDREVQRIMSVYVKTVSSSKSRAT
jgi:glycosyltransferase involved in cell wall biosynthesis